MSLTLTERSSHVYFRGSLGQKQCAKDKFLWLSKLSTTSPVSFFDTRTSLATSAVINFNRRHSPFIVNSRVSDADKISPERHRKNMAGFHLRTVTDKDTGKSAATTSMPVSLENLAVEIKYKMTKIESGQI